MKFAILLYDDMTVLDAIGPYEVLAHVPGHEVLFCAKEAGTVTADTGFLKLIATHALGEVDEADVLIIPGGHGSRALMKDQQVLDWVRAMHAHTRFTTSVCTGALILGAAGLLKGRAATTHWTQRALLSELGARTVTERVVWSDKLVTAAGVSAGIDMALELLAKLTDDDTAKAVQLAIEYDPQPPFDCGSPEKAPAALVELVAAM